MLQRGSGRSCRSSGISDRDAGASKAAFPRWSMGTIPLIGIIDKNRTLIEEVHGMSSLANNVSFDAGMMWVELLDGRRLGVPLAYFPRLLRASSEARMSYTISGGGKSLHWDELDEDISVEGLLQGVGDRTSVPRRSAA